MKIVVTLLVLTIYAPATDKPWKTCEEPGWNQPTYCNHLTGTGYISAISVDAQQKKVTYAPDCDRKKEKIVRGVDYPCGTGYPMKHKGQLGYSFTPAVRWLMLTLRNADGSRTATCGFNITNDKV